MVNSSQSIQLVLRLLLILQRRFFSDDDGQLSKHCIDLVAYILMSVIWLILQIVDPDDFNVIIRDVSV